MNGKIEISPYGNMLVYEKEYSSEFVKQTIRSKKLSGLRIFDHLDPLESLDFLRKFNFLEKLDIDSINDHDFSFLSNLFNSKSLGIGQSVKEDEIIDLS